MITTTPYELIGEKVCRSDEHTYLLGKAFASENRGKQEFKSAQSATNSRHKTIRIKTEAIGRSKKGGGGQAVSDRRRALFCRSLKVAGGQTTLGLEGANRSGGEFRSEQ